jgi:hypothetical protein
MSHDVRSQETGTFAIARTKSPAIPEEAIVNVAPAVDRLLAAFRPLLAELEHTTEPAITLSESAVMGKVRQSK